jgi:hypothetical protein
LSGCEEASRGSILGTVITRDHGTGHLQTGANFLRAALKAG